MEPKYVSLISNCINAIDDVDNGVMRRIRQLPLMVVSDGVGPMHLELRLSPLNDNLYVLSPQRGKVEYLGFETLDPQKFLTFPVIGSAESDFGESRRIIYREEPFMGVLLRTHCLQSS